MQAVYFAKRAAEPVKKENLSTLLTYGDISHLPLDHLSFIVDTVSHCPTHPTFTNLLAVTCMLIRNSLKK